MIMLDTILIVDATMIVGVLFAEAMGRALGAKQAWDIAAYMSVWGYIALLPFSLSAIMGLVNFDAGALWGCGIGFGGFVAWFLLVTTIIATDKDKQCQHLIDRNQLDDSLKKGFVVVTVLPDGKIVME